MKFLILVLTFISSFAFGQTCLPDSTVTYQFDSSFYGYRGLVYDSTFKFDTSILKIGSIDSGFTFHTNSIIGSQQKVRFDTIPSILLIGNKRKGASHLVWWAPGYTIRKTTSTWLTIETEERHVKSNYQLFPKHFFVVNQIKYP